MLARADPEDGLLTVKATTFKFLGNFWSPQKEAIVCSWYRLNAIFYNIFKTNLREIFKVN